MDKEDVVHIYNVISLSHEKEWNNATCSNIDGPRDCHTEKVTQRKTYIIWHHLYVKLKKKMVQMNLFTKEKQSHRWRKQTYGYQWEIRGGINWEIGIDMYTLYVHSVMSDSLQPHGLQPTWLLCSWNFPGKNVGVGCHFLLQTYTHYYI